MLLFDRFGCTNRPLRLHSSDAIESGRLGGSVRVPAATRNVLTATTSIYTAGLAILQCNDDELCSSTPGPAWPSLHASVFKPLAA